MGGLFSSESKVPEKVHQPQYVQEQNDAIRQQRALQEAALRERQWRMQEAARAEARARFLIENQRIEAERAEAHRREQRTEVRKLPYLLPGLLPTQLKADFMSSDIHQIYRTISVTAAEDNDVRRRFGKSGKRTMVIVDVSRVYNPYLLAIYEAKRRDLSQKEERLFHGTKRANVDAICRGNFDRRLVQKYKFGKGVSFSKFSFYATHYCDKNGEKVMFLCKVLVGNKQLGNGFMTVPDDRFDTATNDEEHVFVKFDDDVYYPEYKITFIQN